MLKWILYVLFVLIIYGFQSRTGNARWIVTSGCSLKVDGRTNINQFSCVISNYSRPDTIIVARSNQPGVLLNGNIRLDVQKFDCHNPIMTADLRKTLKSKEFPQFVIRFVSMNKNPEKAVKDEMTKGYVVIDIAGKSKKFEVDYMIVSSGNGLLHLEGSRTIHFSDFSITPPRKLGGMIRTNDELSVVFNLRLKIYEE